jgi:Flp pilus assembly protein TadD
MEAALKHLIEIEPENQHAYNALGYTFADRNIRLDEALILITKAHQLAPDDPYIMDSLGWVHFRRGNVKDAEKYLRRAYEIKADPEVGVHLGEVLWVSGQKAEAQKLWRDAKQKDPQNESLKNTIARLNAKL